MINSRVNMFTDVIYALNTAEVFYCILHGYADLEYEITSDIDIMVSARTTPQHFVRVIESTGIRLVQHLQHEATCHYLIFTDESNSHFLHLDISTDYRRDGVVFYQGDEILAQRRQYKNFWVPAPHHEFGYYLAKRIAKAKLETVHSDRLSALYTEDPAGGDREIERFFPGVIGPTVQRAASSNNWSEVQSRIHELRRDMLARMQAEHPDASRSYRVSDLFRRVGRIAGATGVHVVLLGPDGSGKSTIIAQVDESLAPAFRRTDLQHLFPSRGNGSAKPQVTDPHGEPPRGRLQSLAKMVLWGWRYTIDYACNIRSKLVRSTLVVSDRYFPDIIVDPKRYRYGGPAWLPKLMWRFLPKPDLVILLDAPTEVLQQRKQEVTFSETERQVRSYRALVGGMKDGHIVNADQPVDAVVADVNRIILNFMAARTRKRLKLDHHD